MSKAKNSNKNGKNSKLKTKKTRTIQVPVRLEVKPDGRIVWDVAEVHKTIAKVSAKDPFFDECTSLTKKDASAISLAEIRTKVTKNQDNTNESAINADLEAAMDKTIDSLAAKTEEVLASTEDITQ